MEREEFIGLFLRKEVAAEVVYDVLTGGILLPDYASGLTPGALLYEDLGTDSMDRVEAIGEIEKALRGDDKLGSDFHVDESVNFTAWPEQMLVSTLKPTGYTVENLVDEVHGFLSQR